MARRRGPFAVIDVASLTVTLPVACVTLTSFAMSRTGRSAATSTSASVSVNVPWLVVYGVFRRVCRSWKTTFPAPDM